MADKASTFLQMIRRDRRGRLKVYLGYAAGVGKTYLMLQEAQRLKAEGIDVVVGVVETHGREDTARLAEGLERVPLRRSEYRGIQVEEMDLDGLLARRPQVALVDELAHTNAPGSRNAKRYQDVEDILAAGINVIATLNVQHLESLYDTVEKATGVKVRERLPDAALAEADQIVNVDVSPEDLQKRLRAGKIYPLARVSTALENFFQAAHLEQLRELTLREAASQIDFRRREAQGAEGQGATEQVMVCLDARGPENAVLLRYGSRLAGRLNRNWYAVYVQTLEEGPTTIDAARQRLLSDTLTLANQLGATVFTLKGEDVAGTLVRFAREYRVGHIILGKAHSRPWWMKLARRAEVVARLLPQSEGMTVILIDTRTRAAATAQPGGELSDGETTGARMAAKGAKAGKDSRGTGAAQEPAAAGSGALAGSASGTGTGAPAGQSGERLKLTDVLDAGKIRIWEEPVTKEQAMRELTALFAKDHPELDPEILVQRLREREAQGSTFLNEGVALPHARLDDLEAPLAAVGLTHGGVLDAFTENSIEVVFLLFSPKDGHRSHLQLLAVAGRMMLNRTLRNQLRKEKDPRGVYEWIAEFENRA
jgi:two-component system sensor histidine kinase KdpD